MLHDLCKKIFFRDYEWSGEAIDHFETITRCGQWKPLLATVIKFKETSDAMGILRNVACLKLVDTNSEKDIDIQEEMVHTGYAAI